MKTHADKAQNNKSLPTTGGSSQQSDAQFADNRVEAVAQKKLKDAANSSPQAAQMKAYSDMANNSADIQQLKAFADVANNSPHVQQLKAYGQIANTNTGAIQRKGSPEEEPLQGKFEPVQKKENKTGLPDTLKSGIEHLSGMDISDVKVHYNSARPAQLQAHAYAQGTDIHVAPGQEKHLPHEAWHVVQQKQGRVKPTLQMKAGTAINDDAGLENEADVMGAKANGIGKTDGGLQGQVQRKSVASGSSIVQMALLEKFKTGGVKMAIVGETHDAIDKTIERATWREEKIDVQYEAAKFEIKGGDEAKETKIMAPDPRVARLLYVVHMMVETLGALANEPFTAHILTMPLDGVLNNALKHPFKEAANIFGSAKESADSKDPLLEGVPPATVDLLLAAMEKWKTAYNRTKDAKERKVKDSDIYDSLGEFMDLKDLLETQTGKKPGTPAFTSADYSSYRSGKMYETILEIAASVGNTIYKVGDSHIKDMEDEKLPSTAQVELVKQSEYVPEFNELKKKHGH